MSAEALAAARRLLADERLDASVEVAGHAADVLVVHTAITALATLQPLAARLRALGFRYITVALAPDDA